MVDTLIGFAIGLALGATVVWMAVRRVKARRLHPRLPPGWTMVELKEDFDLTKSYEMWAWLDENCVVIPEMANSPYKKSSEWMMLDGFNRYGIKDKNIAFAFKMRWA